MTATATRTLRLGGYVRLSEKKTGDADVDLATQIKDTKAEAVHNGGEIVKWYTENDTSAFKKVRVTLPDGTVGLRVRRDVFQELYRDLYSGAIDGFVGYHLDRVARDPRDLEDLIDLVTLKGVKIYGVASEIDLASDQGIMMARFGVIIANQSSRDTSRRVARKHRANMEAGKPGGGFRPFGFCEDKIAHDPAEAAAIRRVADRLTAGASFASQVRYLTDQGFTTTRGNAFTPASLRQTLRNPRLCGIRAKWAGSDWETVIVDGAPVKAVWDPIISPDEWHALQAAMRRGKNSTKGITREGARRYLLAGIGRCGACGSALRGVVSRHGEGRFNYACLPKTQGGCGGIARDGKRVDAIVTEAVLVALSAELQGAHTDPAPWAGAADLERLEARKAEATAAWKSGALGSADYFELRGDLDGDIKRLLTDRKNHDRATAEHAEAVDVVRQWGRATLQEKRAAVRAAFSAVVIDPLPVVNGRKVRRWNPDLIRLIP